MSKRSLTIAGHRTSVSLKPEFWAVLSEIAGARNISLAALVGEIDKRRSEGRKQTSLSSAIRLYVLAHMAVKP